MSATLPQFGLPLAAKSAVDKAPMLATMSDEWDRVASADADMGQSEAASGPGKRPSGSSNRREAPPFKGGVTETRRKGNGNMLQRIAGFVQFLA